MSTLNPIADSRVKQATPDDNYGGEAVFYVLTATDANQRSFLKFDLSSLPAGAVITLAKLRVKCSTVSDLVAGVTDVQARRVSDDTWTEGGITWNNQPAYGDVEDTKVPAVGWVEWDVTAWVQNEWAGDKTVSICLRCVAEDYDATIRYSGYDSREGFLSPELYIELAGTVGPSTDDHADRESFQRKCFYANGRFWAFYSDGVNMVYETSTDGLRWPGPTIVRAVAKGVYFSIWFDGTYLHYAAASTLSTPLYYRRGTPNADGTITWSADEQTVHTTYDKTWAPFVSVDTDGYVWIGYADFTDAVSYPYVIKSGNNDGTWGTTPAGFPKQLSTTSSDVWRAYIIPLTDNKMLAVYSYDAVPIGAMCWNSSSWEDEVTTASSARYGGPFSSAVAQGDDVHLVFLKDVTYDIIHVKYTYSTNSFGAETTVQSATTSFSAPVLSIDTDTNNLYCFWAGSPTADHIYYKKYVSGVWDAAPTDWIDESTELLTGNQVLTSFYKAYNSYIGLVYMTGTSSLYNVKFDFLTIAVVAAPTVTTIAADSIEVTTANPKGNVTDTGGENPTRYIDYDTDSGEPYAHSKECGVGGVGEYDSNLTGLSPGQKYYYRARAVNSGGTGKGDEMTFTTKEGGTENCGVGGVGPYEKVMTGLTPNTTYRFKARGVNTGGTGVGVEKEFTTLAS